MRPILICLYGMALLSLAAYLVETRFSNDLAEIKKSAVSSNIRNSDEQAIHPSKPSMPGAARKDRSANVMQTRKPKGPATPFHELPFVSGHQKTPSAEPSADGIRLTTPQQESPAAPARAFRLGSDVRLPAALMHQAATTAATLEIAAANQGIIDSFYQEIFSRSADGTTDEQENPLIAEVEETLVIPAGKNTDSVRERADEIYRALYGNEAFNRYSIESAVEVRLPELSE
jgi:hypothetical protein